MKSTNKVFIEYVQTALKKQAVSKDLLSYTVYKENKYVEADVGYYDVNNQQIGSIKFLVNNDRYELLMSESPEFAPGKPADDFREDDLLYIIDLIENE
ncbi:hypothetical protein A499_06475 [Niallia nealsonii AAU1]|nr:hypothetical protein A499_06475 [Niallia nealsonii AAU1]